MITISLCMIVKNEEKVLARCLESVKGVVDEIIIVDTGSTDSTKKIAEKFTDKVFDFEWCDDFGAARNESFSHATMDYQMWLDADDVMPEESAEALLELKKTLPSDVDIVAMKYFTHFDDKGTPIHISTRERLMKREKDYKWIDPVHECIPLIGNVRYTDIVIHHRKIHSDEPSDSTEKYGRNLKIYQALEKKGADLTPRQLYYFAREWKDHGVWDQAAIYFEKFLETGQGWIEDNVASCYNLSICYNQLGEREKMLPSLLRSFVYDSPRPEVCCHIAYYYKEAKNYAVALRWFDLALHLGEPRYSGFVLTDYWGYVPNIEACVCSYHLGDLKRAKQYNEAAAKFKPYAPAIEINRKALADV